MTWETRFRELILAGGAVVAAGCNVMLNDLTDAGDGGTVGTTDAADDAHASPFCCNANSDPCCTYLHCGAPLLPVCACALDGGTWTSDASDPCVYPGDAGAGGSDAGAEAADGPSGDDAADGSDGHD
jgi:hypothetical protein